MNEKIDIAHIWKKLESAELDPVVGIKIVPVVVSKNIGYYAAEIHSQIQAHLHKIGDEFYHVLKGKGIIHMGVVRFDVDKNPIGVNWEESVEVGPDDVFNIPAGYAHSLQNTDNSPLIISFICPPDHLGEDRIIVDQPADKKHQRNSFC